MAVNDSQVSSSDPAPLAQPAPPEQPQPAARSMPAARAGRRKTKRFWNWKLIFIAFIAAAAGFGGFVFLGARMEQFGGLGIGIVGLWILSREIWGIAINDQVLAFPSGRRGQFPILSLGRRVRIKPGNLRELTVVSGWYSFQVVEIQGGFGSELLVFQTRGQRLRFMKVVEDIRPDIKMFRRAGSAPR